MFAASRDGALPGSSFINYLHPTTKIPLRSVWTAVILDIIITVPALGALTAFTAISSLGTVALYVSYSIPIAFRVVRQEHFVRGPFNLGRWGGLVGLIACLWIGFVTIVLNIPVSDMESEAEMSDCAGNACFEITRM